ncbi:MAG: AsmA-like C-terminal region-containing protein [Methanosarcina sp.]
MKLLKLTGKLLAVLVLSVSVILAVASFIMQDKVGNIIIASLNRNMSVKLDVEKSRLSFLRRFPKASMVLKNVLVHASPGFDRKEFSGVDTDTLLYAESVFLDFKITDILRAKYNIETITAKNGFVRLLSDTAGRVNYEISAPDQTSDDEHVTIDLQKIILDNIYATYNNLEAELIIKGNIRNGKLKSRISGDRIDFTASADLLIDGFKLYNSLITHPFTTNIDVDLQSTKEGVTFRKGTLSLDDYNFNLDGSVSSNDVLDFRIAGSNIDIANIMNYLPDRFRERTSSFNPSGRAMLNCTIKGPFSGKSNPHVQLDCSLSKGKITAGKTGQAIGDLSFNGHFTNGSANNYKTSHLTVNDLSFEAGSSRYKGSLSISNFNSPHTEASLSGRVSPSMIRDFFSIESISEASGSADADISISTDYWPGDSLRTEDLIKLKPSGMVTFNSLSFGLKQNSFLVKNVNGSVSLSETMKASALGFDYEGMRISVDGEFRNLPEWLTGKSATLVADANVSFDRFIPEKFMRKTSEDLKGSAADKGITFPANMLLNLNFSIGNLDYRKFKASGIRGIMNYKPEILSFKIFEMKSLGGVISGNGFIMQNKPGRTFMSRGSFDVSGIDVNDAFTTFNNFGQSFIVAKNLSGVLSGSVSVLLPMDSNFRPRVSAISAEGKYILENGALIDFGPVKELSSFIELSELENIHFEKLENDFFIRNNILYIPQMDVRSSAADLTVNGQHSFENKYEYHVRILLSQILSRKRKKSNNVTEFGVVQDDGLGRTSLLLKVESRGDDMKVGYDLKAAGEGIRNNIKAEKKTLKTILNQEYGWYKDEAATTSPVQEKKPKVRISWGEADSVSAAPREEKSKSLFRKK